MSAFIAVAKCWLLPKPGWHFGTPPVPSDIPRLQKPWGGPACAVPPPLAPAAAFCSSWVGSKAAVLLGGFSALPHGRLSRPEAPPAAATAPEFLAGPCSLDGCLQKCGPKLALQGHSECQWCTWCCTARVKNFTDISWGDVTISELACVSTHAFTGFGLITFQGIFGYTSVASMCTQHPSLKCLSYLRSWVPPW